MNQSLLTSSTPINMQASGSYDGEIAFSNEAVKVVRSGVDQSTVKSDLLTRFVQLADLDEAGIVSPRRGQWLVESWADRGGATNTAPTTKSLPMDLIASSLDRGQSGRAGDWWAVPFQIGVNEDPIGHAPQAGCLVFRSSAEPSASSPVQGIARLLCSAIAWSQIDLRHRHRIDQLTKVLEASANWQSAPLIDPSDENSLLRQIADTATELLSCERASIFLWEKRRKKLIGRPALGIDGRPLEVPDNAGVVGEVLATREPQIWNSSSDDESRVNRKIDQALEFDTRSLVAVPLIGRRGTTIGVFEAINHHANSFDNADIMLLSDLATHAAVAIETQRAQQTLTESRDRLVRDAAQSSPLIGEHPDVRSVRETGRRVANTDLTVLVLGSNGTGKEVVAKHIHFESERRNGPFIAVNCAALVESLLESELFGHEKGSFTDANATRVGKFELANGGTLFLDEVGDMSPGGQAKLLRVLEQKEVVRVGGSVPIPVDVRVIAATNQPLEELIAQKRFREDLFFRLNVVSLVLPDLADRGEDVLLLADHFLQHFCYEIGRKVPTLSESAQVALLSHLWPGNVRELRNTIERVCYLTNGDVISAADLELRPPTGSAEPPGGPIARDRIGDQPDSLAESTRLFQIDHIRRTIAACGGNMTEAAASMELHRSNLYRKMKQLGMDTSGDRDD